MGTIHMVFHANRGEVLLYVLKQTKTRNIKYKIVQIKESTVLILYVQHNKQKMDSLKVIFIDKLSL